MSFGSVPVTATVTATLVGWPASVAVLGVAAVAGAVVVCCAAIRKGRN